MGEIPDAGPGAIWQRAGMGSVRIDLVLDCDDPDALADFWQEALGYRTFGTWDGGVALAPQRHGEDLPPLLLQRVPEAKQTKNRMHLDIVHDDVDAEVARLEQLGARRGHDGVQHHGPIRWVTMADPENNEFCVCSGFEW